MNDDLTRDKFGKRTDKTGERDLTFNSWHRKYLSNKSYTTDIDFYEYRIEKNGEFIPKAFLEVKQAHVKQKKYLCGANSKAIFLLSQKIGIKFFIILYGLKNPETLECDFWVWEVKNYDEFNKYDESKFKVFFRKYTNNELIQLLENL
ncbi:hypothetical protein KKP91_00415 [Methanothermococcus sp. SCGC AD-155-M21]|nr:hypothetical protein [Methanothermococcus sp. SCGC AD-155-M21]